MTVVKLTDKDKDALNEYVRRQSGGSLSQTYEWGEFQKAAGFKVWRLGINDGEKLVAAATILKYDMPYGKWYLYSPRLIISKSKNKNQKEIENLKSKIDYIARQEGCLFWRFDPLVEEKTWPDMGEVKAPKEIQPRDTIMVDLTVPEDDILGQMKSKWRYNIRLAGRKGVKVRMSTEPKDLEAFYEIAKTTSARDKFHIHEKKYYRAMLDNLSPAGYLKLFVAEYKGKILAVNIVSFFKETATYMHGASSNEHRNVMAPHLLQWEAMKEAKANGFKKYDLYGVAPAGKPNHPWAGITRFKEGFGGKRIRYVGAYDIVYKKFWYQLMKTAMILKRKT